MLNKTRQLPALFTLVCAGALIVGLGEVAAKLVARTVARQPVLFDPQSVWMAPLSMLLILGLPMTIAWRAAEGARRGRGILWAGGVAVAVGAYELALLVAPRLHPAALLVLAAAMGWQSVNVFQRWPLLVDRGARWAALGSSVVMMSGVAAVELRERSRVSAGVEAAQADASAELPNIVLLILDTVRASELSGFGYHRATSPVLDSLGALGITFTSAVSTAPWTLPSHATLFTGRYPFELSTGWEHPLDGTHTTLAEVLRERGWTTGGFSANLRYVGEEYGLARGFDAFRSYARTVSQLAGTTMIGRQLGTMLTDRLGMEWRRGRKSTARVVGEFLSWRQRVGEKRYFAFLNVFDAHEPYAPPAPYDMMFSSRTPPLRRIDPGIRYTGDTLAGLREAYDGSLAWTDSQLRLLIDGLREAGDLERTLIVVTSDHGEEFAEHGHVSHGNGLHFPSLHVPLIVIDPSRPAAARVSPAVTIRDVPATILARTGGLDARIPGRPLSVHWDALADSLFGGMAPSPVISEVYRVRNQPARYPASRGDLKSVVVDGYHYIAGPEANEELYHLELDPLEQRSLTGEPSSAAILAKARAILGQIPSPR